MRARWMRGALGKTRPSLESPEEGEKGRESERAVEGGEALEGGCGLFAPKICNGFFKDFAPKVASDAAPSPAYARPMLGMRPGWTHGRNGHRTRDASPLHAWRPETQRGMP